MSMKQLLKSFVLIILAIISFGISQKTIKMLKYEICGNNSKPIDSSVGLLGTNKVLIISDEWVYELQMKNDERPLIQSVESVFDWSDQTLVPIDLMKIDENEPKAVTLVNCETRLEWKFIYEDNLYKGQKKFDCNSVFEILVGKKHSSDLRYTTFYLEYFQEDNVQNIRIKTVYTPQYLRSNDSSDTSTKFIKWVIESDGNEMEKTYPFSELNGQTITAAFIYDNYWYLFGGRYYCRVDFVDTIELSYQECNPTLISDWIQNCGEELEVEQENQQKDDKQKSQLRTRLIVLSVIIIVALLIVLIIFCLICKEVSIKSKNSTTGSKRP